MLSGLKKGIVSPNNLPVSAYRRSLAAGSKSGLASSGNLVFKKKQELVLADPYFANVRLLTRGGAVGSQVVTDVSNFANDVNMFGNVTISSDGFFTNSKGIVFDGNGDYLISPSTTNFTLDAGDFAVEAFIKPTIVTSAFGRQILGTYFPDGGDFGWLLYLQSSNGNLSFFSGGDGSSPFFNLIGSAAPIINAYNYVAVARISGLVTITLNNATVASTVSNFNENYQRSLKIATQEAPSIGIGNPDASFVGTMDENIRITKGVGRDISTIPLFPFASN